MMTLQIGDLVQLTGATMMGLYSTANDLFVKMLDAKQAGGKVTALTNDSITLDIAGIPLTLEVPQGDLSQVVQRIPSVDEEDQPAARHMPQPHFQFAGMPFFMLPDDEEHGAQPTLLDHRAIVNPNAPAQVNPVQLRLAQWTVSQILALKQHTIAQQIQCDRHSNPDSLGIPAAAFKALALSDDEESLYNTALRKIQRFIQGPTKTAVHPEVQDESQAGG